MNPITKIIIGTFALIFFYACEKTIEFKGDNIQSKIVVNGNLIAEQPLKINISKSQSLLSEEEFFETLPNAIADLYEDNTFIETLTYTGKVDTFIKYLPYDVIKKIPFKVGNFSGKTIPKAGRTYRLEVTCDGFESVHCETTVPVPVEILKVDTVSYAYENEFQKYKNIHTTLHFNDPGNVNNYYRIESELKRGVVRNYNEYKQGLPFSPSDTILIRIEPGHGINSNDPLLSPQEQANDVIFGSPENRFNIFNDTYFNGKESKISIYNFSDNQNIEMNFGNFSLQRISLISISKEYYNYLNTANYHFWYDQDPFSEPVPVTSNVVGGMGIFGSSGVSSFELLFGNYPTDGKTYITEDYNYNYGGYSPYN